MLEVAHNRLGSGDPTDPLGCLASLPRLQRLDLRLNGLTSLPASLFRGGLPMLRALLLGGNAILSAAAPVGGGSWGGGDGGGSGGRGGWASLLSLGELDLSGNRLQDLGDMPHQVFGRRSLSCGRDHLGVDGFFLCRSNPVQSNVPSGSHVA
jgi:Leucine-rich repeat (LRR) protein